LTYLLDTNAAIAVLRNKPAVVRERLRRAVSEGDLITVSSVVLFEFWYGVARTELREQNTERLRVFLAGDIRVVPFDERDAFIAGDLRATLEKSGTPIGRYDVLIAAQALSASGTLVTANVSEVRTCKWSRLAGLGCGGVSAADTSALSELPGTAQS
jgi:tRNA(fMet)-specific endonuclease VapC